MTKKMTIKQQREELTKRLNGRNLNEAIIESMVHWRYET